MAGSQNGRIVRSVLCTCYQGVGLTSCSLSLDRFSLGNKCPYSRKGFPVLGWASDLMFVLNEYRRYLHRISVIVHAPTLSRSYGIT